MITHHTEYAQRHRGYAGARRALETFELLRLVSDPQVSKGSKILKAGVRPPQTPGRA